MTSREVYEIINQDNGQTKLYKMCEKHFNVVDSWEEKLTSGDMLSEYELADCIDKLTGCIMKFAPIAGALEAIMANKEHNTEVKGYAETEKLRTQDCSVVRANARASINDLRGIVSDFRNYFIASEKGVTSAQSRIKRLTVEKGAKNVDFTGETQRAEEAKDNKKTTAWG